MKALVMSEPGNVKMTELPMPEIKSDEVLVRVRAAGICINDVRDFKGECDYSYPRIGGHEFAGEIYEIGSEVNKNRFHVGQRVVPYVVDNCKECYYCKNGFENVCPDSLNSITYKNPDGISGFCGFGQFVVAKAEDLYIADDNVPFEKLAVVEPVACVINSINNANVEFGDDVLVIGGGTMGMLHVMLAHMKGANVILSEPVEERRKKALELGANAVIDPTKVDVAEEVKRLTDGLGAKIVFNTTAIPAIALQALDCTAKCGTMVMFSSLHPNKPVEINLGAIHSTQKNITGAQNGTVKTFWQAVKMLNRGVFDPTPIIEDVYDYHDFDQAMACAMRPDTYKVVLKITD